MRRSWRLRGPRQEPLMSLQLCLQPPNSEVNKEITTKIGISSGTSVRGSVSHCGYLLDLEAKATYYLNCKTGQASMTATHAMQGKRAEDEGEGGVRLFMREYVYYSLIFI